jgi:signal transduction histidine kinase
VGYSFHNDYLILSHILVALMTLPLSLFILWKSPREPVNRYFFLFGACVASWSVFTILYLTAADPRSALLYSRICNLFALFIFIFFYHCIYAFLDLKTRALLASGYGLTFLVALLSILFPDLWIDRVNPDFLGVRYNTHGSWLFGLHPALGLLLPGLAQMQLISRYKRSVNREWRRKCRFILSAGGVSFLGGFTSYFMVFEIPIFAWGVPLIALYPPLISYAIIRYRLINIQTVIHKTILWMALSSLVYVPLYVVFTLTRPWLATQPTWALALFSLGLFFLITLYYRTIQPEIDHLFQRRKYDLQKVLDRLLERLAVLGDTRELIQQINRTLVETLYASHATFLLSDEKTRCYLPFETAGTQLNICVPLSDPFIDWARQHVGVIPAGEVESDPAYSEIKGEAKAYFASTRAAICIPLSTGHVFVGLLHLGSKTNLKPYGDSDLQFLEKLRVEAAIALSNALLYDQVMRLNLELTDLNAQLEEKVRARTAELEAANRKLTESNRFIAEADRAKTQFLANISHELRTPLNAIIGFSKLLLKEIDGPLTEKQREDLEAVHHSGTHLLGLISDLLDLSKIEAGKMELAREPVDLVEIIRGVMTTAHVLVKEKSVELRMDVNPDLPRVEGDPMRLRQVILNLVSNAVKFTDIGEVEVRAELRGTYLIVSVRDTGRGIRPEDQPKLFEEFRQLEGGHKEGTGLGLAISKRLVQLHGGEIWAESFPGEGSTFTFSLPLTGTAEVRQTV